MASYIKDKKTGQLVLQSRIETPYQPDPVAADRADAQPSSPAAPPQPETQEKSK